MIRQASNGLFKLVVVGFGIYACYKAGSCITNLYEANAKEDPGTATVQTIDDVADKAGDNSSHCIREGIKKGGRFVVDCVDYLEQAYENRIESLEKSTAQND